MVHVRVGEAHNLPRLLPRNPLVGRGSSKNQFAPSRTRTTKSTHSEQIVYPPFISLRRKRATEYILTGIGRRHGTGLVFMLHKFAVLGDDRDSGQFRPDEIVDIGGGVKICGGQLPGSSKETRDRQRSFADCEAI